MLFSYRIVWMTTKYTANPPKVFTLWVAACLAILLGTSLPCAAAGRVDLTVSAAISLMNALQSIRSLYRRTTPGVSISLNLGASGILEEQIKQGAPVDVFISASPQEMNGLEKTGLLVPGTRENLLANTLVLISPKGSDAVTGFKSLATPQVRRVAIAEPESVPAGTYARQTLEYLKLYSLIEPKLIFAANVRQVLAYVETDNVDAGFVYTTDAAITNRVKVVATAPPPSHAPIVYPVAVVKGTRHIRAAEAFVRFLSAPEAQQAFRRAGFLPAADRRKP